MTVEDHLYTRLTGYGGLTTLVGTRIYPQTPNHNTTLPYIVFHRVSTLRHSAFSADIANVDSRVQFDIWSNTYDGTSGVIAIGNQLRAALQRYSGTSDGTEIETIFVDGEFDEYDPATERHRRTMDFMVHYKE